MKARFVSEAIEFERGQDPKSAMGLGKIAEINKIVNDEDEVADMMVDIDQALGTAMEIYLPEEKKKQMVRMWLENVHGLKKWEFKSIVEHADDAEEEDYVPIKYEIDKLKRKGWKVLHNEDNYDIIEVILYR